MINTRYYNLDKDKTTHLLEHGKVYFDLASKERFIYICDDAECHKVLITYDMARCFVEIPLEMRRTLPVDELYGISKL